MRGISFAALYPEKRIRAAKIHKALERPQRAGEIVSMAKAFASFLFLLVSLSAISAQETAGETPPPTVTSLSGGIPKGAVVVIPLKGEISKAQFYFLRRIIKTGEESGASAFILDMDTPGGELGAGVDILQTLLKTAVPTITYVNPNAGSAGALIALGTRQIWMAPVSAIGAAAPVMSAGQEIPETLNAKIVSYYSGYFRSAAERNGYNPEIAEGFINRDMEVKIGDRVISKKGELLTLSAQEAAKKINGKPVLASGVAPDIATLARDAGLTGEIVEAKPSGFEQLALIITMLSPLLLLGGIVGTYIEFKTPGFGVPGALAAVCFLLFFAGHYIAGLTGLEVVAIFVLGMILVILELLLFPGVAVIALAGAALMIGSLLWAMVDYYPEAPEWPPFDAFLLPLANLGAALGLSAVIILFLARFFPQIPVLRRLVLATSQPGGDALSTGGAGAMARPGDCGRTLSMLRPVGRAEFGGVVLDARTEGDFLPAGTPVVILRFEGTEAVVQRTP